jgi:hypothetical protein
MQVEKSRHEHESSVCLGKFVISKAAGTQARTQSKVIECCYAPQPGDLALWLSLAHCLAG